MANLNKELAAHESLQLHLREESDKLQAQLESKCVENSAVEAAAAEGKNMVLVLEEDKKRLIQSAEEQTQLVASLEAALVEDKAASESMQADLKMHMAQMQAAHAKALQVLS